ncbi:hemerythrin domain-containing protein [Kribbella sp. NPDC050241]|uniref:hemerythrin domain-containing protein n=1 Tax=Kribbella sp. NPDC050241 TaxID=3364115 RepID=UPI0037B68516
MSAATLRSVNESLRDELARLRVLADSPPTNRRQTDDLRAFCAAYCDTLLAQQAFKRSQLYQVLAAGQEFRPVVERLSGHHGLIAFQLGRIRQAAAALQRDGQATGDLRQSLTELSALLEDHLSDEENHLLSGDDLVD